MAKLIFQNLNQIVLMITISLLVYASESIAGDPCRRCIKQVSRSTSLHETVAAETVFEFEETALAQNIPLERVKWPMFYASPYCSVGKLLNDENCTAFMISKNHALTAKHCAIRSRRPGGPFIEKLPVEKLTLCLGRQCDTEGTCLTARHVKISDWADYALITYNEDHWCTHWLRYSDSWDDGSQIELIGYRCGLTKDCQYDPLLHSVCSDTTGPHEFKKKLIYYNCESLPGMSGSPMSNLESMEYIQ